MAPAIMRRSSCCAPSPPDVCDKKGGALKDEVKKGGALENEGIRVTS